MSNIALCMREFLVKVTFTYLLAILASILMLVCNRKGVTIYTVDDDERLCLP